MNKILGLMLAVVLMLVMTGDSSQAGHMPLHAAARHANNYYQ